MRPALTVPISALIALSVQAQVIIQHFSMMTELLTQNVS